MSLYRCQQRPDRETIMIEMCGYTFKNERKANVYKYKAENTGQHYIGAASYGTHIIIRDTCTQAPYYVSQQKSTHAG